MESTTFDFSEEHAEKFSFEAKELQKKQIITALKEGEESGFYEDFDPKSYLEKLQKENL